MKKCYVSPEVCVLQAEPSNVVMSSPATGSNEGFTLDNPVDWD